MIKPSVGRIVWFTPGDWDGNVLTRHPDQPLAAIVAYVHSDRMVNLTVFDANGHPHGRTSVQLVQDGDPRPDQFFCEWMPYQKGQAAKTEQLEKQVSGC